MKKLFSVVIHIFALIGFVLTGGYFAVKWGWTNTKGIIDKQSDFFYKTSSPTPVWSTREEWSVFEEAVKKDEATLTRVSKETGIESRLIVANLIIEQLRLYYSEREVFKQIFSPLKILGNQSQFSWGVMGLKQETAAQIEHNLKDSKSPFYLGASYEDILDFNTDNHDQERFRRITDEHDRYYSYLYTALYLKQVMKQWNDAGFDISNKPEILSTLFNIGFEHSKPNAAPKVGGAEIDIAGKTYSFGSLAREFYYSNELLKEFPRKH